jgi:hypothetical protein
VADAGAEAAPSLRVYFRGPLVTPSRFYSIINQTKQRNTQTQQLNSKVHHLLKKRTERGAVDVLFGFD